LQIILIFKITLLGTCCCTIRIKRIEYYDWFLNSVCLPIATYYIEQAENNGENYMHISYDNNNNNKTGLAHIL